MDRVNQTRKRLDLCSFQIPESGRYGELTGLSRMNSNHWAIKI